MEWWQIVLIGVASIIVGILLGALFNYLTKQFVKWREMTSAKKHEAAPVKKPETASVKEPETASAKKPETALAIEEELEWATPDLLAEIESNLKVATEPWTGNLLPFQTRVWDTLQGKVDGIPVNLQDELSQVYIDMRLANSVVRLSTQFNHRTYSLNESYMKLCTSIAEKLGRIKPIIERSAKH